MIQRNASDPGNGICDYLPGYSAAIVPLQRLESWPPTNLGMKFGPELKHLVGVVVPCMPAAHEELSEKPENPSHDGPEFL